MSIKMSAIYLHYIQSRSKPHDRWNPRIWRLKSEFYKFCTPKLPPLLLASYVVVRLDNKHYYATSYTYCKASYKAV